MVEVFICMKEVFRWSCLVRVSSLLAPLLCTSLSFSPAFATEDKDYYVKIEGGYATSNVQFDGIGPAVKDTVTGNLVAPIVKDSFSGVSGIVGGIGVGYYISDEVRLDGMLYFNPRKKKISTPSTVGDVKYHSVGDLSCGSYSLMVGGYYDILGAARIVPYLSLAAGVSASQTSFKGIVKDTQGNPMKEYNGSIIPSSISSNTSINFAYTVGAGVYFPVTKNFFLDLNYRIGNNGGSTFKQVPLSQVTSTPNTSGTTPVTTPTTTYNYLTSKSNIRQALNVGIRFNF